MASTSAANINWQRVKDFATLLAVTGMILGWLSTGVRYGYRVETLEAQAHEAIIAARDVRDVRKDAEALKGRFDTFEKRFEEFEQKYDRDAREQRSVNTEILRRLPR
jgi:hypothetical protein